MSTALKAVLGVLTLQMSHHSMNGVSLVKDLQIALQVIVE